MDDPLLADDGYPSDAELDRIKNWPIRESNFYEDLAAIMAYVHDRWKYDAWEEQDLIDVDYKGQREHAYVFSMYGWSGNESLIGALEENEIFRIIAPYSWRRGGHYEYRIPLPE